MQFHGIAGRARSVAIIALTAAAVAAPGVAQAGKGRNIAAGAAAAGVAGLIIGSAIAANAEPIEEERVYRARPSCWLEKRSFEDRYGDVYIKKVRVCR